MRNLHLILLQEYGIEAQHLFREWERLRLRASDYKNRSIGPELMTAKTGPIHLSSFVEIAFVD